MTSTRQPITACLLHADVHVMTPECWGATFEFDLEQQEAHPELDLQARRDAYQAAVERRMLDQLRTS